jgi:triacylglycerol lipase
VVVGGWLVLAGCATALEPEALPDGELVELPPAEDGARSLATGATRTRYPIVLAHGMSGWKELFGALEYFHGIPADLRGSGAEVYVTSVSAFASSEARGEQLLEQVEYIAAVSGAGKVNLIGHSQGGYDARYVAAVRPDLVASVTTVGTPHRGSRLADWLLEHTDEGGFTQTVIDRLGDSLGFVLNLLAGTDHPQDAIAAIRQVSSAAMADFNRRYPQGMPQTACGHGAESANGIRFWSWSGTAILTHAFDPSDAPFVVTSLLTGGDNDGLVERCGSHFGRVVKDDYRMNHLDQVNQVLGLTSWFEVTPKSVFRAHAARLRNAGL